MNGCVWAVVGSDSIHIRLGAAVVEELDVGLPADAFDADDAADDRNDELVASSRRLLRPRG